MATVTRENIGLLNDKISVTISKNDYLPSFDKALKQYAKSANIPGFRKGMVPTGMIKKMYGPSVFADEVLRTVEKELVEYLDKEQVQIFAQPLPAEDNDASKIDMNNQEDYTFNFEVGLRPDVTLPTLDNSKLTRYVIEPDETMVTEEIERLKTRHGNTIEPEAIATDEDMLNLKFEESDADGNVKEEGIVKETSLLLKYFSEAYRPQLIGKKLDDSVVLQVSEAFEEKEKEFVAKDLGLNKEDEASINTYFKVTITKIGLVEKRELNEEFFKEVFADQEIKTEEEFKAAIKAEISKAWQAQTRNQFQHELYHQYLDNTQLEFPESFLKKWLATNGEQAKSPEQVEEEFPGFKDQLKWTLITDKIVADNKLEVSPDEIRDHIAREVMGYFGASGLQGDMAWLGTYVDRLLQDKQQVENTYRRVLTEKVFAQLETTVAPTEKNISVDDFKKLQEEHQHHHHA